MTEDLDPTVQQRFDREFERIPVPAFRARRARGGWLLRGIAVALLAIGFVVGGRVISELRAASASGVGYSRGVCTPTDVTTLPTTGEFYPGYYKVLIGGDLAGTPHGNLGQSNEWYLRSTQSPLPTIHLRAERLDAPSPPVIYTAIAYPLAPGFPQDWTSTVYYRTTIDAPDELPSGCWRVSWIEGSSGDSIVYETKTLPTR
jgi:hypothetical protein